MKSYIKIPTGEILDNKLTNTELGVKILIRSLSDSRKEWMRLDQNNFAKSLGVTVKTIGEVIRSLKGKGEIEVKEFKGNNYGRSTSGYKVENNFSEIGYNDIQFNTLIEGIDQELLDLYFSDIPERIKRERIEEILISRSSVEKLEYLDMYLGYKDFNGIIKEDLDRVFKEYLEKVYSGDLYKSNLRFKFAGRSFIDNIIKKAKNMRFKKSPYHYMSKMVKNLKHSDLYYSGSLLKYSQEELKEAISQIKVCSRRFLMVERDWVKSCIEKGLNLSAIIDELRLRVLNMYEGTIEFTKGVVELAKVLGRSIPTISKNLSNLFKTGVIYRERSGIETNYSYSYVLKSWFVDLTDGVKRTFEDVLKMGQRFTGIKNISNLIDKYSDTLTKKELFKIKGISRYNLESLS